MKVIEKIIGWFKPKAQPVIAKVPTMALPCPNKYGEPLRVDMIIRVRLYTENGNEQVRMSIVGLGDVNVCLASFLAKGVSYAQEKYNEYKQSPKDIEPIEEAKPKIKAASVKEWQERVEARKGGKR